jgi:hypothetical protein
MTYRPEHICRGVVSGYDETGLFCALPVKWSEKISTKKLQFNALPQ